MTDTQPVVRCRHGRVEPHQATDYTRSGVSVYHCPGGRWYAEQGRKPPTATWPDGSIKQGGDDE